MSMRPEPEKPSLGAASTPKGYLPLVEVAVKGRIEGLLFSVKMSQTFVNSYSVPLEVTYVFPLPPRSAVAGYVMKVGKRTLKGKLQGRSQARKTYRKAIESGHTASLAEQERPDVFTVAVGNLAPNESLTVELELEGPLALEGREASFRFPLVVGQRYIPGQPLQGSGAGRGVTLDTDVVPDASRLNPPVLLPGMPNPIDLRLELDVDPCGLPVLGLESSLHEVQISAKGPRYHVSLGPAQCLDRDFVLRLRLATKQMRSTLVVSPDKDGATFLLTVIPPIVESSEQKGRDVVILLDRSGSMAGWKMVAARTTAGRIVETLGPADRFGLIAFDTAPEIFSPDLLVASDANRAAATAYLRGVEVRGGTELQVAFSAAERYLKGGGFRETCLVLVTDGEVGDHDRLLAWAHKYDYLRLHAVGIGEAANSGLLDRLATMNGGLFQSVEDGGPERLSAAFTKLRHAVNGPVLSDVSLVGAPIRDAAPERWDVFSSQPALFHGRLKKLPTQSMTVAGILPDGTAFHEQVHPLVTRGVGVGRAWARAHLLDLDDQWAVCPMGLSEMGIERSLPLLSKVAEPVRTRMKGAGGHFQEVAGRGIEWMERTHDFWKRKGWPRAGAALAVPALPIVIALTGTSMMAYGASNLLSRGGGDSDHLSPEEREEMTAQAQGLLELEQRIEEISLRYGVLSRFTAFVCVDKRSKVVGPLLRVLQPVEQVSGGSKKPESVVQLMQVDPISVEFGKNLIGLADPVMGAPLLEKIPGVRRQLALDLGMMCPGVRLRDSMQLAPDQYLIKIKDVEVARGEVKFGRYLALGPEESLATINGSRVLEPTYGMPAVWIEPEARGITERANLLLFDSASVVATHLAETVRRHAADLLGRQETQALLSGLASTHLDLVKGCNDSLQLGELQKVLQNLLSESVSIVDLVTILETLVDNVHLTKNPERLTEFVRVALAPAICDQYQAEDGGLTVFTLEAGLEQMLEDCTIRTEQGAFLTLAPHLCQEISMAIAEQVAAVAEQGLRPILLVAPPLRSVIRELCERPLPQLVILSSNEMVQGVTVRPVGLVTAPIQSQLGKTDLS
jgi:Ca-activated chloride channel family protein